MSNCIAQITSVSGIVIEISESALGHALEGHPEVTLDMVRRTCEAPSVVIKSKKNNTVCLFYRVLGTHSEEEMFFCVVIESHRPGRGRMLTAYETNFIKSGDILFDNRQKGDL